MRCEEVRELLPGYAEWGPRPAGAVEQHIASCPRCSSELAAYRDMLTSLAAMRDLEEEPPAGYLERTLVAVGETPSRTLAALEELRTATARVASAAKRRPAVASLTAGAIGVAAVGILMWRRGRKPIPEVERGLSPA